MHRKPQLQEAARKLQEIFNNRTGEISYVQALEILGELEGFEGYQQLRAFVAQHSQPHGAAQPTAAPVTAPVTPVLTGALSGPPQTLAMALCGHGGFHSGFKRVDTGRPDVRFVQFESGETFPIEFVDGKTNLWQLADIEAGFPYETEMDPKQIIAHIRVDTRVQVLTVLDMQRAEHVYAGRWKVAGRTMTLWDCSPLCSPVKTPQCLPNPSEMTREEYLALSQQLERLEMSHAMGEEYDGMYWRMKHIDALLSASPWVRDMDSGEVVLASESIYGSLRSNS